jgi:hypothetical protein
LPAILKKALVRRKMLLKPLNGIGAPQSRVAMCHSTNWQLFLHQASALKGDWILRLNGLSVLLLLSMTP